MLFRSEDGGMASLIGRRCFAIVLIAAADEWVPIATAAGYREEPLAPLWTKALEAREPWVKLTRTGGADSKCPVLSEPGRNAVHR